MFGRVGLEKETDLAFASATVKACVPGDSVPLRRLFPGLFAIDHLFWWRVRLYNKWVSISVADDGIVHGAGCEHVNYVAARSLDVFQRSAAAISFEVLDAALPHDGQVGSAQSRKERFTGASLRKRCFRAWLNAPCFLILD